MKSSILKAEAEECRVLANEFAQGAERTFLLCVASAFDDLHVQRATAGPVASRKTV